MNARPVAPACVSVWRQSLACHNWPAPVKGHFNKVHNQLMHLHSYQIADLFNRRNITRWYVAFHYDRLAGSFQRG